MISNTRGRSELRIEEADRHETKEAEDAYLLTAYRKALERIAAALRLSGSPSLPTAVPEAVEKMVRRLSKAERDASRGFGFGWRR